MATSAFRCFMIAGLLTGRCSASLDALDGDSPSWTSICHRVWSARAASSARGARRSLVTDRPHRGDVLGEQSETGLPAFPVLLGKFVRRSQAPVEVLVAGLTDGE